MSAKSSPGTRRTTTRSPAPSSHRSSLTKPAFGDPMGGFFVCHSTAKRAIQLSTTAQDLPPRLRPACRAPPRRAAHRPAVPQCRPPAVETTSLSPPRVSRPCRNPCPKPAQALHSTGQNHTIPTLGPGRRRRDPLPEPHQPYARAPEGQELYPLAHRVPGTRPPEHRPPSVETTSLSGFECRDHAGIRAPNPHKPYTRPARTARTLHSAGSGRGRPGDRKSTRLNSSHWE